MILHIQHRNALLTDNFFGHNLLAHDHLEKPFCEILRARLSLSLYIAQVGEDGRPRREFERRSGTGRGSEIKRDGAGRGNWGMATDEFAQVTEEVETETDKNLADEKPVVEEEAADAKKDSSRLDFLGCGEPRITHNRSM